MKKLVLSCALAAALIGVPAAMCPAQQQPAGDFDMPPPDQMERIEKKIESLRMWKVTQALDLDEKGSAALFPLLNEFNKRRVAAERAMQQNVHGLKKALTGKAAGELPGLLDEIEKMHRELQKVKDDERAAIKKVLSVEQQAKYVLFQLDFEREIRKLIEEARQGRRSGPGPEGGEGGPARGRAPQGEGPGGRSFEPGGGPGPTDGPGRGPAPPERQ